MNQNIQKEIKELLNKSEELVNAREESWDKDKEDYIYNPQQIKTLQEQIKKLLVENVDNLAFDFIFEILATLGHTLALISDGNGYFGVSSDGVSKTGNLGEPEDITIVHFFYKEDWAKTPKGALKKYLEDV